MASASGSGNDQDDHTQEPAHGSDESSAATVAAAVAEPPPDAPPVEGLQERVDEGSGGGEDAAAAAEAAAAAAAAARKGKGVVAMSSPSTSPPGSSSSASSAGYVYGGAGGSSSPAAVVDNSTRARVSWRDPLVEGTVAVPKVVRQVDLKELFDTMVYEQEAIWDLEERFAEEQRKKRDKQHAKPRTRWIGKRKSLWREVKGGMKHMLLDRIRRRLGHASRSTTSGGHHVHHQTILMTGMIQHYQLLEKVTARGEIFHSNALLLRRAYSEFRPVHGDGECFYRSFIFSYLEQVLDRPDTHEEYRLLAAVKRVAKNCADLGWTSEFSKSHKAFKKLIKKVMRWKRRSRWKRMISADSYRRRKLLEFFSGYDTTRDSEYVAAIWICSHREEYEPLVPDLREDFSLTDWCFREVIRRKVFTDHVQITALVTALGVPLRVEYLFQGNAQDLYTGQDVQDDMPRSTCWPRLRHLPPSGHQVPRVTVLYSNIHYDILYPHRRDGPIPPVEESCSGKSSSEKEIEGEESPCGVRSFAQVPLQESTGESSSRHTEQGGSPSSAADEIIAE
ncbi:hypothetical protein ACP70R_026926 [Stipagrostis hirtigluma subsp. patula]